MFCLLWAENCQCMAAVIFNSDGPDASFSIYFVVSTGLNFDVGSCYFCLFPWQFKFRFYISRGQIGTVAMDLMSKLIIIPHRIKTFPFTWATMNVM